MVREHPELRRLSESFVCVRLVKMNGVDLKQFQFDYDLSWAALFLRADGTVYARYGSRSAAGPMVNNSAAGLLNTMRRVLEAHRQVPANRHLFAQKRGPEPPARRPEEIVPRLAVRRRGLIGRGAQGCIHCHDVHEALHEIERQTGVDLDTTVFKYPLPENVGLVIDTDSGRRVARVLEDSPASEAGVRAGDEISTLNGQAILSIADLQFALHHLPGECEVEVELERDGKRLPRRFRLARGWRKNNFLWRASMKGFPPSPGLYLFKLGAAERKKRGIDAQHVALEVLGLFKPAARRSGLRTGDVIVSYDGKKEPLGAPKFEDYLRLHHFRADSVLRLEVLRDGEVRRVDVKLGAREGRAP